jgi:hypothetical protein
VSGRGDEGGGSLRSLNGVIAIRGELKVRSWGTTFGDNAS